MITFGGKTITKTTTTAYEQIIGYTDGTSTFYSPKIFSESSNYFITYTLTGVPNSAFGSAFTVVPQWTTFDGTTVTSNEQLKFTVNQVIAG